MQLLDMYEQYALEHEGLRFLKTDYGFASYKVEEDGVFYVQDLFIKEGFRGKKQCQEIGNRLIFLAKELGCTKFYGSVAVNSPNTNRSARMLLDFNMNIVAATPDLIYFCREI